MEGHDGVTLEALLEHSCWVRALAGHLVRRDAEDLVQDVWTAAAERPPGTADNPRGWLFRVLTNRLRTRARGDARRRRREEGAAVDAAESPATPEEAASRMELHRLLAELVAELPEPYRHVVYLRYVEDRQPSEIAELLGAPAGTIRWRLKEALSRLRAALDERHGGNRSAWMGVFTPLATPAVGRPRTGAVPAAAGLALVSALAVGGVCVLRQPPGSPPARGPAERGAGGTQGTAVRGLAAGPPQLLQATVAEEEVTCPELEPLRAHVATFKAAIDPWRNIHEVFAEGSPNPILEARARPLFAQLLSEVPDGCQHSVACRGTVCEVAILIPDGIDRWQCHPETAHQPLRDYLSDGMNNSVDSGTPLFDPLQGKSYTKMSLMQRFYRADGAPVPPDQRPSSPELPKGLSGPRREPPGNLSAVCRKSWERLVGDLAKQEGLIFQLWPDVAYEASLPNEALTAKVASWAGNVLGRLPDQLPFQVSCRARACALEPGSQSDPLALNWQCRPLPGVKPLGSSKPTKKTQTTCFPRPDPKDWVGILREKSRAIGRFRPPRTEGDGRLHPGFLVVRDVPRDAAPPGATAFVAFWDSFDWRSAIESCEARFPAHGELKTMLRIPETIGNESPPNRVSWHAGGAVAGTALGRCITAAFEEAAARFVVPPVRSGLVNYETLTFPFDFKPLAQQIESARQHLRQAELPPAR